MVVVTGNNHIDFSLSGQYTLSIRLRTDGFSFCIYDTVSERILTYIQTDVEENLSLAANLRKTLKSNDFLNHSYGAVNVIITGKRFTLLPESLFAETDKETIFYYNLPHRDNESILFNKDTRNDAVFLFGTDSAAHHLLLEHFPNACFYSQLYLLHTSFTATRHDDESKRMYVALHAEGIDVLAYDKHGELELLNVFETSHVDDKIYYLLHIWQTLEFDQQNDVLHLYGDMPEKEKMMDVLKKYISHISFLQTETNLDFKALL